MHRVGRVNLAIKHCMIHHFVDHTNLLNFNKRLNKLVNNDLKNLTKLLNACKILLNVLKTEMVIFREKKKVWTSILSKTKWKTTL